LSVAPRAGPPASPTAARRRDARRDLAAGLVVAALGASALVAQLPQFGDRETVVAVEIPIHVLVDGRPVSGLRADDFEVFEGRRRQAIVGFDVVDLAVASSAAGAAPAIDATLPPAARRFFLLLFDLSNAEPHAVVRARRAAQQLVAESLLPTDLVGVATWSLSRGATLQLGFTSDRAQVDLALETLGLDRQRSRPDPLGILLADIERSVPGATPRRADAQAVDAQGRSDADFLADLQRLAAQERSSLRGQRANEAMAFSRGIASLARMLASIQGRKQVVLLSQGFDEALLLGADDPAAEAKAASDAAFG